MQKFLALVLTTVLTVSVTAGIAVTMDPEPAAAAPASSELDSARKTILSQTNAARAGQGLKPLVLNAGLNVVAQEWSKKQSAAGAMSHNPYFFSQYPAGATSGSENVAYGYTVDKVTPAWLNSPGHYKNIMSKATDIGIGYYYGTNGTRYYTQNFAFYPTVSAAPAPAPAPAPALAPVTPSKWKDFNGDGRSDVIARDRSGYLWLYLGTGSGLGSRVKIGSSWNGMTSIAAGGDFSGDGKADVIARDSAGSLWLYHGTGSGLGARTKIGSSWNGMTSIAAGGDFNSDGKADVIARDSAGSLWLYSGTGSGLGARTKIGSSWYGMTSITAGGDLNNDGKADVLARDKAGYLWLYKGTGSGLGTRIHIGSSWNGMTAIL